MDCVELLEQMVSIPSESQNEEAFARFLCSYLHDELGMESELQHIAGKSYNVLGYWKETGTPSRRLLLGGHIDTVVPTPRWKTDPYRLTSCGDELHGLGAADMKGGLAAQLTVLKCLRAEGKKLNAAIEFVGLADEERHSIGANAYVTKAKLAARDSREAVFLMGEPHYDNLVIGATGKALLSLRVQGKEGHASTPERGVNAIDCMATLLCAMQKKYMPQYERGERASDCCLQMASDYAGYSLTIPAVCSALINKQLLPTESLEAFISELETLYQSEVGKGTLTIQREIPSYPAYQLSPQQKDIQHLTDFLHKRFGRAPELRINQSVSDGNILYNSLGIPTILFGPHGIAFHTENEYVKRSSLTVYMEELYAYILAEYEDCPS